MLTLKALPAYDGDCFIISLGEGNNIKNIIIDGGRKRLVVTKLKKEILDIINKGQVIDLMILTHIDNDHIYGLIKLFEENWINKEIIKEVWFNSKEIISNTYFNENANDDLLQMFNKDDANISYKQGITFSERLEELDIKIDRVVTAGYSKNIGDAQLKVISPEEENLKKLYSNWDKAFPKKVVNGVNISSIKESDYECSIEELLIKPYEEDKAIVNGSSIAFVLEYKGKKILMLADSHPSIIMKNLRKIYGQTDDEIYMDLIKLSHHGSKRNINEEFVNNIKSDIYLISTNGETHGLPNKETIVKIAKSREKETIFYFNYSNVFTKLLTNEEIKELKIRCKDVKNNEILKVDLWSYLEDLE